MSWSIVATTTVGLFIVGVACLPMDLPATNGDTGALATSLKTPPLPEDGNEKDHPALVFLINVIAVKNISAEDPYDVLHSDVLEEVQREVAETPVLFLLVVAIEDENHPVNLDDVAKDLQNEGFSVEKVVENGETRLIKVDLDNVATTVRVPEGSNMIEEDTQSQQSGNHTSVRRKRSLLKLKKKFGKYKGGYGGGHGGGCGGGCGGGGYYVTYQPVYYYVPQQRYHSYHGCNVCG